MEAGPGGGMVVAVAAVVIREGRVLCMRRSPQREAGAGLWETLSGRVEPDEDPLEAVRREIDEECGLAVELDPRPLTAYPGRRAGLPMVVIVYRARWISGRVRRSSEHDAHAWLATEELAARSPLVRLVEAARSALADPWPEERS